MDICLLGLKKNLFLIVRLSLFGWLIWSTASCVTPLPKALEQVELGMDKSQVLEKLSHPRRSHRIRGQDEWTYTYYVDGQEFSRSVFFEMGKVVHISPAHPVMPPQLFKLQYAEELEALDRELEGKSTSP